MRKVARHDGFEPNPVELRYIEHTGAFNEDAGESIFFARELEYIKSKAYDIKYPELSAMALMPISTEAGEGAESITYKQYDSVGMAKIIANYADDLPRADVTGREFTSPVRGIGISYGYNTQEIRASAMVGKALDIRKMQAARKGHNETINKFAWSGDSVSGLPGFLTNPNMPEYTIPANGTGSSKLWVNKTDDQILADLNGMVNAPAIVSKGVHNATEIWLPRASYTLINSKRVTDTSTTILKFFLETNPGVTVKVVNELTGAGAGGTNRAIVLENSSENYTLEIPMMFKQHVAQQRNLEFVVPCESRFGGVIIYYPLAFAFADGI